ncbi:MAG: hypothetical protein ABI854_05230 [Betaproteobacteria bacterium]
MHRSLSGLLSAIALLGAPAFAQQIGFPDDMGLSGTNEATVAYNARLNKAMLRYHNAWPACANDSCRESEYAAWREEITTAGSICFQVDNTQAAVTAARAKGLNQSCVTPTLPPASTAPAGPLSPPVPSTRP